MLYPIFTVSVRFIEEGLFSVPKNEKKILHDDVEAIHLAVTGMIDAIPKIYLQKSTQVFVQHEKQCINAEDWKIKNVK